MTDETASTPPAPTPETASTSPREEVADAAPSAVFGLPIQAFVRGGTTSSRHDNALKQQAADDEKRRSVSDEERRLVRDEGAKMFSRNLGTPQQHPVVKLTLVNPRPELNFDTSKPVEILADVYLDQNAASVTDLTLNLACPYCWSNGVPHGRCQFKVLQSNRFWALDMKGAGELVAFDGQVYQSAGTVRDSERIRCPQCSWTFKIDGNRIYEERGV